MMSLQEDKNSEQAFSVSSYRYRIPMLQAYNKVVKTVVMRWNQGRSAGSHCINPFFICC
jgi:hypothetical protein